MLVELCKNIKLYSGFACFSHTVSVLLRTPRLPTPPPQPAENPQPLRELHVGAPNIGDRQVFDHLVDQIFRSKRFTNNGPLVREFEQLLADYLGVRHCITVSNGTVGLQIACQALELSGEVIMPAFTFVATPHAISGVGLTPVFADVDLNTHTLCPASVESQIGRKTAAIVGVHCWGNLGYADALQEIADKHGLPLFFDAAHAFGCGQQYAMAGNFGRCEVFSFHATKFFNTFEGGAIATNDDALAEKIRSRRNFGFAGMDCVAGPGTNAKMPEICAAMGISMFARLDEILAHNKRNCDLYHLRLAQTPGIRLYSQGRTARTNWQYVVLEIDEQGFGCTRDQVMAWLHQHQILARRYFFPGCHTMPPYVDSLNNGTRSLKNTDWLCQRVLCLPTGGDVSDEDVNRVCDVLLASRGAE